MTNQEIIDNAPEGATHVDNNGFYLSAGKSGYMTMEDYDGGRDWDYAHADLCHTRSLADIKEIEQLKAELVTAKAELDELGEQCRKVTFFKLQPLKEQGE